jgi:hypothetical protein
MRGSNNPHPNLFSSHALGAIRIAPSPYWPREPDGFEVKRIPAHPFIHWLARWFPINPWIEVEVPKFKDADAMLDVARGVLYCSPAQADELMARLAR